MLLRVLTTIAKVCVATNDLSILRLLHTPFN